jgi:hypothetical protein
MAVVRHYWLSTPSSTQDLDIGGERDDLFSFRLLRIVDKEAADL